MRTVIKWSADFLLFSIVGFLLAAILTMGCQRTAEVIGWRIEKTESADGKSTVIQSPNVKGDSKASIGDFRIRPDGEITIGGGTVHPILRHLDGDRTLLYAGIVVTVAMVVAAYFAKSIPLGILGVFLGAGFIGLGYYPHIAGIAVGIILLAGLVYIVFALRSRWLRTQTLTHVVQGVEDFKTGFTKQAEWYNSGLKTCLSKRVKNQKEIDEISKIKTEISKNKNSKQ